MQPLREAEIAPSSKARRQVSDALFQVLSHFASTFAVNDFVNYCVFLPRGLSGLKDSPVFYVRN